MSNDSKFPNADEMTMASEADKPKSKGDEDFGEQGTMASEAGTTSSNTLNVGKPSQTPMQQTMASMPGNTSNTGPGRSNQQAGNFVAEDLIGTELNSYKIIKKIAEGGMGVVLLGEHTLIGRRGAIKVLKPEFCEDEAVVQRFYQEGRAVNAIQHENIVDIYDFGRMENGGVYFIMEFLEGEPLSSKLSKGPMSFAESLPVLEQTLRALKAAHDKGFIHRDLKPDNLFLVKRDGAPQVKILDFGIAKLAGLESAQEKLTRTGSIIGTPHYMSPEQIEGSVVDLRTDIYAMGVIMYEIWTGDTPFKGETLGQVIKGHLMIQAPRLENLKPDLRVPGRVAEIVAKALEKDRDHRFANAAELLAELQAAAKLPFTPIEAKPAGEEKKTAPVARQAQPTAQIAPEVVKLDTTLAPPQPKKSSPLPIVLGIGAAAAVGGFFALSGGKTEDKPNTNNGTIVSDGGNSFVCGNGKLEGKEACDDGNKVDGDGCNPSCAIEVQAKCPDDLDDCDWKNIRDGKWSLLRNSLNEEKPEVRVLGADALGDLKDKQSSPELFKKLLDDPDNQVKATAARAIGEIGDKTDLAKLQELAKTTEGPLKAWLVDATAHLGDATATKTLEKLVNDALGRINAAIKATKPADANDIAIVLDGGIALAKLAEPGNKNIIELLRKIAMLGATISEKDPTAGPRIAGQMARLGDAVSRQTLQGFLSHEDEGIRITAAEQLANLGDDSGKATLTTSLTSDIAANKLAAARILVTLGDYTGYDTLLETYQKSKDDKLQQIAVEGLARIAERDSLKVILPKSEGEVSWVVKIPSAVAVLMISGLEPAVLTQASVDWVSASLASNDVTARVAAVKVIGDLPKKQATDLFLSAVAAPDPDPNVRKALLSSGGKITKSPEVTKAIAALTKTETNPEVKATGVLALGNTKDPSAIEPLKTDFLPDPGRIGVLAAGSLVELGDEASGKPRLESALLDPKLKSDAIEAIKASESASLINEMLPPLTADRAIDVKLLAAEAIASSAPDETNKGIIQPVLEEIVKLKDPTKQARAVAALNKIGVNTTGSLTIEEYLASPETAVRESALPLVAAKGGQEGIRYTRMLLADSDTEIREQTLDILEGYVGPDRANVKPVVNMLKIALEDPNEGIRNRAQLLIVKIAPDGLANKKDAAVKPLPIPETKPEPEPKLEPKPACGDGKVDSGEECDDSNTTAGDGCDASCKKEAAAAAAGPYLQQAKDAAAAIEAADKELKPLVEDANKELDLDDKADDKKLKDFKKQLTEQLKIISESAKILGEAEKDAKKAPDQTAADVVETYSAIKEAKEKAKQEDAKKAVKDIEGSLSNIDDELSAITSLVVAGKMSDAQKRLDKLKPQTEDQKATIKKLQEKIDGD